VICAKDTVGGIFCATVGFIWCISPIRLLPEVVILVQNGVDCWCFGRFWRLRRQQCRELSRFAVVSAASATWVLGFVSGFDGIFRELSALLA
jgi:hypothetical protein